jgi:hypothetical protein
MDPLGALGPKIANPQLQRIPPERFLFFLTATIRFPAVDLAFGYHYDRERQDEP